MYKLLYTLHFTLCTFLLATVSHGLPTNAVTRTATEAYVTNKVAQGLAGKVSTTDATYTATVARASSAYAWGDHSAAGYLASSAWLSWQSTNQYVKVESDPTVAGAIAAFGATNRVYSIYGTNLSEWVSIANGTATLYRVTYTNGYLLQGYGPPLVNSDQKFDPPYTYYYTGPTSVLADDEYGYIWTFDIPSPTHDPGNAWTLFFRHYGESPTTEIGCEALGLPWYNLDTATNFPVTLDPNMSYYGQGYWIVSRVQIPISTNAYPLATTAQIPVSIDPVTNNQTSVTFSNLTATGSVTLGGVERSTWPEGGISAVTATNIAQGATADRPTFAETTNIVTELASAPAGVAYVASNQTFTAVNTFSNVNNTVSAVKIYGGGTNSSQATLTVQQQYNYVAPYTHLSQSWRRADGTEVAYMRVDGKFYSTSVHGGGFYAGPGTAAVPSFGVSGNTGGLWFPSTHITGITSAGTNRLTVSSTAVTATVPITAPSFVFTNFAKLSFMYSNGTNLFFVNVNAVTNQLTSN